MQQIKLLQRKCTFNDYFLLSYLLSFSLSYFHSIHSFCFHWSVSQLCEVTWMKISISEFKPMVFSWKCVDCSLWVVGEVLPQVEEFHVSLGFCSQAKEEWSVRLKDGLVQFPQYCGLCTFLLWCLTAQLSVHN